MKRVSTRKITAYHEAAHAVVQYRTSGFVGGDVTIVPRADATGIIGGSAADDWSDSFSPEHMEATILSCYAGGHAQREVEPLCGAEGCDKDDAQADEQLRWFGWQDREQELRERSLVLTRKHWAEIEAVADELLRHKVLDYVEVETICDAAAGDAEANIGLAQYRAFRERMRSRRRD